MNNVIQINDTEIPVILFAGHRVLPFKLIDKAHNRKDGTAKENFKNNRQRFIENIDFFTITRGEFPPELWENFGFSSHATTGNLITATGYLMLVKSFTDDLAWDVQRELVNRYFITTTDEEALTSKDKRRIRTRISSILEKMTRQDDALTLFVLWQELTGLCDEIDMPYPNLELFGKHIQQITIPGFDVTFGITKKDGEGEGE